MATAFSNYEKELIIKKLSDVAQTCLLKYGVKKTTVNQIVQMTGISKGSFYSFYSGKEILFFKVIEDYQKFIIDDLTEKLSNESDIGVDKFTEVVYELYRNVKRSFIMNIIKNREMEYLMRKLPKEIIINHHSLDDILTQKLFSRIKINDEINIDAVSASLRAIFMSMLYVEEIGEKNFDEVLKLLIKGLALQIIDEESQ
ncbi:MAG: TetR/AcrR family transcriptional regulator [Tissierellia bacterium]|nr:TetR/AcrR family transcriptional regulator [Tissierellia bacterium]